MAIELEEEDDDDDEEEEDDDDDDDEEEEETPSSSCCTLSKSERTESHDPVPHPERKSYLVKSLTCSKKSSSSLFNFFTSRFIFLLRYSLTCDVMSNGKIGDMYTTCKS